MKTFPYINAIVLLCTLVYLATIYPLSYIHNALLWISVGINIAVLINWGVTCD